MSATFFPPMTDSAGATTSWIPLTTTWPEVGGDGSANIYYDNGLYKFNAWLPDDPHHAWGATNLPPEYTEYWHCLYWNDVYKTAIASSSLNFGFAPFAGCPEPFTPVATSSGGHNGTLTACCPPYFDLYTPNGILNAVCTSSFTDPVITFLQGNTEEFSWGQTVFSGTKTYNTSTSVWVAYTTSWTLTASVHISAPPISGWNFPASMGAVVGKSNTAAEVTATGAADVVPGAYRSATIALAVLSGVLLGAATALAGLYLKLRRRIGQSESSSGIVDDSAAHQKPEVAETTTTPPDQNSSLPSHSADLRQPVLGEMYAFPPAQELESENGTAELPGLTRELR